MTAFSPTPPEEIKQKAINPAEAFPPAPEPSGPETGPELPQVKEQLPTTQQEEGLVGSAIERLRQSLGGGKSPRPTTIPIVRDALTREVERIMETGLSDAYQSLTPAQKQAFKIAGESTAFKIRGLLRATHVKIKKIFLLLLRWLKLLPGVNKFYLEQEAKIKADKILALKRLDKLV